MAAALRSCTIVGLLGACLFALVAAVLALALERFSGRS